mgnify:FL=1
MSKVDIMTCMLIDLCPLAGWLAGEKKVVVPHTKRHIYNCYYVISHCVEWCKKA